MRLAVECPACGDEHFRMLDRGGLAPFVAYRTGVDAGLGLSCECDRCGMRFCRVRFDDDEVARLYADYRGQSYNEERERFEPGYTAMFGHLNEPRDSIPMIEKWIERTVPLLPGRVLDIGGNDGRNTPFGDRAVVWDVFDPEPEGDFDLVVMAHVLEHVSFPRDMVATARRFLSRGGVMFAEVPVDPPVDGWHEHVQQFTQSSLFKLFHDVIDYQEVDTSVGRVRMVLSR
jgi:hypothetical protein